MPSFYLFLTFSLAYTLYLTNVIAWETPPIELHFWCIITSLSAFMSMKINGKKFQHAINEIQLQQEIKKPFLTSNINKILFLSFTVIGILGILKYIMDYSSLLGAFSILTAFFVEDTGKLRTFAENVESIGTQLSYFSWFSAFIITVECANKHISRKWLYAVSGIILLNCLFLDRTRPVWLIFVCMLIYFFITYETHARQKIVRIISSVGLFFIGFFILIGSLLGKDGGVVSYTQYDLPAPIQLVLVYFTSSFAYLGRIFQLDYPIDFYPMRVTYPLQKVFAKLSMVEQPPPQVLEFMSVPHLTNVGTFLEPFLRDGGWVFILAGILLHSFVFDKIAMGVLKRITSMGVIIIATLCFINFMAFFVPKIVSTATWFTLILAFVLHIYTGSKGESKKR
jgi:oligosaccharide repeat unit polymerase